MVTSINNGLHPIGERHMQRFGLYEGNAIDQTFTTGPSSRLIIQGKTMGTRNASLYNTGTIDITLILGREGMYAKAPTSLYRGILIRPGGKFDLWADVDGFMGDVYAISSSQSFLRITLRQT